MTTLVFLSAPSPPLSFHLLPADCIVRLSSLQQGWVQFPRLQDRSKRMHNASLGDSLGRDCHLVCIRMMKNFHRTIPSGMPLLPLPPPPPLFFPSTLGRGSENRPYQDGLQTPSLICRRTRPKSERMRWSLLGSLHEQRSSLSVRADPQSPPAHVAQAWSFIPRYSLCAALIVRICSLTVSQSGHNRASQSDRARLARHRWLQNCSLSLCLCPPLSLSTGTAF